MRITANGFVVSSPAFLLPEIVVLDAKLGFLSTRILELLWHAKYAIIAKHKMYTLLPFRPEKISGSNKLTVAVADLIQFSLFLRSATRTAIAFFLIFMIVAVRFCSEYNVVAVRLF